jgi:TolA-binding protein
MRTKSFIVECLMKKLVLLSLLGLLALTGCARQWVITLNNGSRISTRGKPQREGASYVFKDGAGTKRRVSAGSVAEIAPASMANQGPGDTFRFNPSK